CAWGTFVESTRSSVTRSDSPGSDTDRPCTRYDPEATARRLTAEAAVELNPRPAPYQGAAMGPVVQQGGRRCPRGRASRPPVLSLAPVLALEVPAPDYLEGRVRLDVSLEPVRVAPEFLPHQVLEGNGPSVRDVPAAGVGGGVHFS